MSSQHLNSSYTQLTSPPQGGTVGVFLQKQRCFGTGKMAKLMLDASVLLEEHRPQKLSNATKLSRKTLFLHVKYQDGRVLVMLL